jgi:hypothetical protein
LEDVPLNEGKNEITLTAKDKMGNPFQKVLIINRTPASPKIDIQKPTAENDITDESGIRDETDLAGNATRDRDNTFCRG